MKKELEHEGEIKTRTGKLLGYCPHCELMISDLDMEGKKYLCKGCGEKLWKKDLIKKKETKKWESKREYLKGNSGFYGENFHMNKSTTDYNSSPGSTEIKTNIIKSNDEENTLD
jgi:methionyl-tRNA synthetase